MKVDTSSDSGAINLFRGVAVMPIVAFDSVHRCIPVLELVSKLVCLMPIGSQGRKRTRQQREQTHDGDPSENSGGVTESEATTSDDEDTGCETEGSGEGDSLDEDPEDNTVDVTLEFFDPRESDFLGLKALLQSFLDGQVYAGSELADTVIQQVQYCTFFTLDSGKLCPCACCLSQPV